MVNNFELIKSLLKFENEDEFYFIQILQRRKEHENLGRNNRLIQAYYINSLEKLEKLENEIIKMCDMFNARAYINLNRRSNKTVLLDVMANLANRIKNEQYENGYNLFNTACGSSHIKNDKLWIVDVDGPVPEDIVDDIDILQPFGSKLVAKIPTKNGTHLITHPFNKMEFKKLYPEIQIHSNNPTCLYFS